LGGEPAPTGKEGVAATEEIIYFENPSRNIKKKI
jgi:hypothetical protein